MKPLTRREMAAAAAAVLGAAHVAAQTPQPQPAAANDLLTAARESKRSATEEIEKFPVETAVEPAFQFKA